MRLALLATAFFLALTSAADPSGTSSSLASTASSISRSSSTSTFISLSTSTPSLSNTTSNSTSSTPIYNPNDLANLVPRPNPTSPPEPTREPMTIVIMVLGIVGGLAGFALLVWALLAKTCCGCVRRRGSGIEEGLGKAEEKGREMVDFGSR